MKLVIELDSTKVVFISVLLVFLLITSVTFAQRRGAQAAKETESPSIASQFGGSFVCLISQCGWPAIIFLILPAIAVFFWKKYISLG